jgi:hypothetical protein
MRLLIKAYLGRHIDTRPRNYVHVIVRPVPAEVGATSCLPGSLGLKWGHLNL